MRAVPKGPLSELMEMQPQSRLFLTCLVVVLGVLVLDLFYVADTVEKPLVSQTSLSVFVIFTLVLTATVAKKAQDEHRSVQLAPKFVREDLRKESQDFARSLIRQSLLECNHSRPAQLPSEHVEVQAPMPLRPLDETTQFMEKRGEFANVRDWICEVRKWFSKDLIPLILSSHIENCKMLNSLLRRFTSHKEQFWVFEGSLGQSMVKLTHEEENYYRRVSLPEIQDLMVELNCNYQRDTQASQSFSLKGHQGVEQAYAQARLQLMETVLQRQLLEAYFKLPGYDAREYVIERLHELALTSSMSGYSNKSGGGFRGDVWSPRHPTDARILAYLFFRMLSAGNNLTKDPKFTLLPEILREFPDPVTRVPDLYFYQRNPPSSIETHYEVIVDGDSWPAWPGSENVFSAVAMFLYALKTKKKGFFRNMNCAEMIRLIS